MSILVLLKNAIIAKQRNINELKFGKSDVSYFQFTNALLERCYSYVITHTYMNCVSLYN